MSSGVRLAPARRCRRPWSLRLSTQRSSFAQRRFRPLRAVRRSLLSEGRVEIEHGLEGDPHQVTVVLRVMHLITGERLGIVDFDQSIAAPSRSIRLDMTHALIDATPIAILCKRLEGRRPGVIEVGFVDGASVLEPLNIKLPHDVPPCVVKTTLLATSIYLRPAGDQKARGATKRRAKRSAPRQFGCRPTRREHDLRLGVCAKIERMTGPKRHLRS